MAAFLRKWAPLLAMVTLMTIYLHEQFEMIFECPSCHLFVDSADGLKNYFTAAYYVKHDDFGVWSEGMNYPYGEHVVYTDNQPIVSAILKALGTVIPIDQHVIGTINMLMIISLIIAAVCLYFIMRSFGLPRWYSAILSVPIALLSPQVARFNGHYSLAYTFYLPLFVLLLIRWAKGGMKPGRGALLTGWIAFMGFTHLYFFFIASIFLIFYGFVHWAFRRFRWNSYTTRTAIVALASAAIVYGTVKLTDTVKDRPETVYGLYVYTAKLKGTFLPWFGPYTAKWQEMGKTRPQIEGTSYIGGPAVLLFLPILLWLIVMIRRRYLIRSRAQTGKRRLDTDPAHPVILFTAALLVWFVATGWFYSIGAGKLVDIFPVIGQFRSLGRIAWIFYYMTGVTVAYAMYNVIKAKEARWKSVAWTVITVLLTGYWMWEGHMYIKSEVLERPISENKIFRGSTPYTNLLSSKGLSAEDFQASFQLPIVSIGSEKISIERGYWWMRQSWQCAWETGLPIITSAMSRTSVSQSLDMVQLLSDEGIKKRRLARMDDRPLLLIVGREGDKRIEAENQLIALANPLGAVNDVDVYSLPMSAFEYKPVNNTIQKVYMESFEGGDSSFSLDGNASFLSAEPMQQFYAFTDTITSRGVLEVTAWTRLGPKSPFFANIRHEVVNTSGIIVKREDYNRSNIDIHNVIGNWVETKFFISVDGSGATHQFMIDPPGARVDSFVVR
jgi:hypothetical protein